MEATPNRQQRRHPGRPPKAEKVTPYRQRQTATPRNPLQTTGTTENFSIDNGAANGAPEIPDLGSEPSADDKKPRRASGARSGGRRSQVTEGLKAIYVLTGTLIYPFNAYDAELLISNADALATSLEEAARKSPAMYKALLVLTSGGAWMAVALAYGRVFVGLGANHGALPRGAAVGVGLPLPPEPARKGPLPQETAESPYAFPEANYSAYAPPAEAEPPAENGNGAGGVNYAAPGLHISQEMYETIRRQAYEKMQREYSEAAQRGELPQ